MANSPTHTILLVQSSKHDSTRFYKDYESVAAALDGLQSMMETRLRELYPHAKKFTYDISALLTWVQDLKEVVLLSYDESINAYRSYKRAWVKEELKKHVEAMAAAPESEPDATAKS